MTSFTRSSDSPALRPSPATPGSLFRLFLHILTLRLFRGPLCQLLAEAECQFLPPR
jgi:hypothetical protein